jgi:colicin import membrane protein
MSKYFLSFLLALSLHLSIIALFVFSIPTDTPPVIVKKPEPVIIEATILDESAITAKANELKQQQEKKKRLQQKQQQDYASKLAAEKQQLQQLKDKRLQAEKAAKEQATKRKKAAQEEQQKLQAIKQKLASEKKKQQEIVKRRQAEEKKRKADAKRVAEEKRKAKIARQEALKKQKIAAEKKQKALAEKLRLEAARQVELNKQRAENARIAKKASADATALIKRKVTQNWNRPGSAPKNLKCKIRIGLIASGDVMSVVIVESSGNSLFDDSAERAVRKASPLPVPKDPGVFKQFRSFSLEFAPDK